MKKFVPYLLFSVTTLHTILGSSPVMSMGCASHSDKSENICDADVNGNECKEKTASNATN